MPGEQAATKGERTRSAIIHAAHELFVEQGYHGTSVRQIAQKAEIALGGIYNHFASKEAIFAVVVDEFHPYREILPALAEIPIESVEGFIRGAFERVTTSLHDRPGFLNLIFIEFVEFNGKHLEDILQNVLPSLSAITQKLTQTSGALRPIPLPTLVRTFMGMLFSYVISEKMIGEQFPAENQTEFLNGLVDIYLHGILERD